MAGFCVNCGTPLTGPFCNKCGARALSPSAPVQAAPPAQPATPVQAQGGFQPVNVPSANVPPVQAGSQPVSGYQPVNMPASPAPPVASPPMQGGYQAAPAPVAPAPKGSGLGKVLLWVGGIFLVLFMVGAGAAIYGVYWVKHKVSSYASAVTGGSSDTVKVVAKGDSCKLLSTADLQKVLGVPIEKSAEIMEEDKPGCAYYTSQQAVNQLQQMALREAKRQADEVNSRPGPKPDNLPALMKNANNLEGVVKALGMTQPSADGQVFSFTIEHGADENSWAGMRLTESAVPGFEEVPGVGDHAMIGAFGHAFYVQKGDAMITMSTMLVPDTRTRGPEIAKKIIGNL